MPLSVDDEVFLMHRTTLRRLAYKMLGCVSVADEVVQETWLRWHHADTRSIGSAKAWLITTASRLCIDEIRKLNRLKEVYYGSWLPEPYVMADEPDPEELSLRNSELSMAMLVLLESLSQEERVAFVLQDVFEHDYASVAEIMAKSEANCRQLVHRAKKRIEDAKSRFTASDSQRIELTGKFASACLSGNVLDFLQCLAPEVVLISDGGGVVKAASKPVYGTRAVSRLLVGIQKLQPEGFYVLPAQLNGMLALAGYLANGQLYFTLCLEMAPEGITALYLLNNPDKLLHAKLK